VRAGPFSRQGVEILLPVGDTEIQELPGLLRKLVRID
jgi:hypothetical protein